MQRLRTPAVILEGVYRKSLYAGRRLFCPRSIYSWWREIWLERLPEDAPCMRTSEAAWRLSLPRPPVHSRSLGWRSRYSLREQMARGLAPGSDLVPVIVVVGQDEVRRGKINHESKSSFLIVLICYYGRAD